MNRLLMYTSLLAVALLAGMTVNAAEKAPAQTITVEIDYGDIKPARVMEHPYTKGTTALDVLKAVADVKTHLAGKHVFITSIDGVKSIKGRMAWYYDIDGLHAKQLAASNTLDQAMSMRWEYRRYECPRNKPDKLKPVTQN